jgi:NADH:ubiquinone oxidoreductase subunit 3 (subunit A)
MVFMSDLRENKLQYNNTNPNPNPNMNNSNSTNMNNSNIHIKHDYDMKDHNNLNNAVANIKNSEPSTATNVMSVPTNTTSYVPTPQSTTTNVMSVPTNTTSYVPTPQSTTTNVMSVPTPVPSTMSNISSTPSPYDTNDNNIYNFPLLHGGNGNIQNSFSNFFKNFNLTPGVLIIFLVVVIVFVLLFSSLSYLGKNNSNTSYNTTDTNSVNTNTDTSTTGNKSHIITVIIIVLIVIAISFLYRKIENTTIIASIKKLFTKNPQVNVTASKTPPLPLPPTNPEVPEIKLYKEVFNIPGNNYTYLQAQSICSAYDAKLASYDELEDAYNKGAEWCNYGWSEGQMALFPTQKKTYNTLQSIKGHEHDCGRPGINGGYMANPNVRYGINCYGHKPKRNEIEKELMENTTPYPLTK